MVGMVVLRFVICKLNVSFPDSNSDFSSDSSTDEDVKKKKEKKSKKDDKEANR
jgi:hypothetical protein